MKAKSNLGYEQVGGAVVRLIRVLTTLFVVGALSACSTFTNPGAPKQSFNVDQDIKELEAKFGPSGAGSIAKYYAGTPSKKARDEFIAGRLVLTNIHYIEFIKQFALNKAQLDSALDITTIGVDLATTLAGGESVKAILGAVSAGLTSSRISVDKNFFQQKTVPVLITAMNAQRKQALIPILAGTQASIEKYPLATAITHLHAYYNAGTFVGALSAIQKDSGVKEADADDKIERLTATFGEDKSSDLLRSYVGWDGKKYGNTENFKNLEAWMRINKIPGSVTLFLSDSKRAAERRKAVKDFQISQ